MLIRYTPMRFGIENTCWRWTVETLDGEVLASGEGTLLVCEQAARKALVS